MTAIVSRNSTNVRSNQGRAPKVPLGVALAQAGFRTLAPHAPALATRVALRMFRTPPRYRPRAHEESALVTADPFEVRLGDARIRGWSWGDGPAVLLVHGWGARGLQLLPFVGPLLRGGFRPVIFDGPAHGASDGRSSSVVEHAAALERVVAAEGPLHGLVAHSMGAGAAAIALERMPAPARVVLLAPPAGVRDVAVRFAAALEVPDAVRTRMEAALERQFLRPLSSFDVTRSAPPSSSRTLVIHDDGDREIPIGDGERVAKAWGAELVRTRGLGHVRLLRDEGVTARVADFIAG
jgi:pimeloyl-ACP methyl ester carboxylesterase